jgi:hypothetical protein
MTLPFYRGSLLAKNSRAYQLWQDWQQSKTDRAVHQRKLDQHLKEVEARHRELLARYP